MLRGSVSHHMRAGVMRAESTSDAEFEGSGRFFRESVQHEQHRWGNAAADSICVRCIIICNG